MTITRVRPDNLLDQSFEPIPTLESGDKWLSTLRNDESVALPNELWARVALVLPDWDAVVSFGKTSRQLHDVLVSVEAIYCRHATRLGYQPQLLRNFNRPVTFADPSNSNTPLYYKCNHVFEYLRSLYVRDDRMGIIKKHLPNSLEQRLKTFQTLFATARELNDKLYYKNYTESTFLLFAGAPNPLQPPMVRKDEISRDVEQNLVLALYTNDLEQATLYWQPWFVPSQQLVLHARKTCPAAVPLLLTNIEAYLAQQPDAEIEEMQNVPDIMEKRLHNVETVSTRHIILAIKCIVDPEQQSRTLIDLTSRIKANAFNVNDINVLIGENIDPDILGRILQHSKPQLPTLIPLRTKEVKKRYLSKVIPYIKEPHYAWVFHVVECIDDVEEQKNLLGILFKKGVCIDDMLVNKMAKIKPESVQLLGPYLSKYATSEGKAAVTIHLLLARGVLHVAQSGGN